MNIPTKSEIRELREMYGQEVLRFSGKNLDMLLRFTYFHKGKIEKYKLIFTISEDPIDLFNLSINPLQVARDDLVISRPYPNALLEEIDKILRSETIIEVEVAAKPTYLTLTGETDKIDKSGSVEYKL